MWSSPTTSRCSKWPTRCPDPNRSSVELSDNKLMFKMAKEMPRSQYEQYGALRQQADVQIGQGDAQVPIRVVWSSPTTADVQNGQGDAQIPIRAVWSSPTTSRCSKWPGDAQIPIRAVRSSPTTSQCPKWPRRCTGPNTRSGELSDN